MEVNDDNKHLKEEHDEKDVLPQQPMKRHDTVSVRRKALFVLFGIIILLIIIALKDPPDFNEWSVMVFYQNTVQLLCCSYPDIPVFEFIDICQFLAPGTCF
uniref:Transmembrane protein n=1 Tax=Amphimedon queenslandica TaxID=400682 RepID=A0A1X7UBV8_AMPQE